MSVWAPWVQVSGCVPASSLLMVCVWTRIWVSMETLRDDEATEAEEVRESFLTEMYDSDADSSFPLEGQTVQAAVPASCPETEMSSC